MKNFYTLVSAILICGGAFAQGTAVNMQTAPKQLANFNNFKVTNNTDVYELKSSVDCSTSSALYCEDFEGVTAPAMPVDITISTNESGYTVDAGATTVSGFYTGDAAAADAGGYFPVGEHGQFAMTNDDACFPSGAQPNNDNHCDLSLEVLQLPELDFTGQNNMWLLFQYYHDKNYGGGDAFVEVSTDAGTNWTPLDTLDDLEAWQDAAIDLSAFSDETSVTIRVTWSDDGSWATGFAIDDIVIDILPEYNLTMPISRQYTYGPDLGTSSYSVFPLAQMNENSGVYFVGYLKNMGLLDQDSARVIAEVASESFSTQSWAANITSLAQDTFISNDLFIPTATGVYDMTIHGESDNNTTASETKTIEVTDFLYGRDDGVRYGQWTLDGENEMELGAAFEIFTDANLSAVDAWIGGGSTANAEARAILSELDDAGNALWLTETDIQTVGNPEGWVTIGFPSAIPLLAGSSYVVSIKGNLDNLADTVRLGASVDNPGGLGYYNNITSGEVGLYTNTWMVRMNFDPAAIAVGVEELSGANFNLYPNPNQGEFTMNIMTQEATDFTMTINNIVGQAISSEKLENVTALSKNINLTGLGKGVYFVTLSGEKGTMTQRVVVK